MAVTLDDAGRYLVDDDGAVRGVKHSEACVARVLELAYGTVFQSGVGTGELRDALKAAAGGDLVVLAFAQDESADVIALYDESFPGDAGNVEEEETVVALDNQITPPDPMEPFFPWTMGVFDLCVNDLSEDSDFIDNLKTLWPDAGGRVIVLSEQADLALAGFATLGPELIDGTYLYLFDRFDPDDAIGEANPHGSVYEPGYGWQP